jgi:hypothetical protein
MTGLFLLALGIGDLPSLGFLEKASGGGAGVTGATAVVPVVPVAVVVVVVTVVAVSVVQELGPVTWEASG